MQPKVSVIIPCHNYGRYVAQAIQSVLSQTYKNFEVTCVNDGSTDNSADILRKFKDRITILTLPQASGSPAVPRNSGAQCSTGELLLFLDADDLIDSRYLEKTVPQMTDGIGVVATWMEMFEGNTEKVGSTGSSYPIFSPSKERITRGNSLPICSLIQRETFAEAGGYNINAPLGSEDWALWASIVHQDKWQIKIVPEYLFFYRVHAGSMARRMPPFEQTQRWMQEKFGGS